jgi:hypothetical protein
VQRPVVTFLASFISMASVQITSTKDITLITVHYIAG